MPNVSSPRDLVSRPDNMDVTVIHAKQYNPHTRTALLQVLKFSDS